jgi:hypothetical protein
MSLERKSSNEKRGNNGVFKSTLLAAGIAGAAAAAVGSLEGSKAVIESKMQIVNSHLLTPAAVDEIKKQTGASDSEIEILQPQISEFIFHALKQNRSER